MTVGFPRLIWFTLLTSAYLASLNRLAQARKEIVMIFYDVREVFFDDVGISERMRDTIESVRRDEGDVHRLVSLTDMLLWLAKKGFRIRICVDRRHSGDPAVSGFLDGLQAKPDWPGAVEVLTKDLGPVGSLHVKG